MILIAALLAATPALPVLGYETDDLVVEAPVQRIPFAISDAPADLAALADGLVSGSQADQNVGGAAAFKAVISSDVDLNRPHR